MERGVPNLFTENGQQDVYEIYSGRFISAPLEEVIVVSEDYEIIAFNVEISRSEMRESRRLLNRTLAREHGSLGLPDSDAYVTIRQCEKEIHFTRGIADIQESDLLISRVLEFFIDRLCPI